MVLQRWSPFGDLRRMEDRMHRLWRGYGFYGEREGWGIPLDVVEEDDRIVVHASLPGVDPEQVHVTVEDDILTIRAETEVDEERRNGGYLMRERRSGSFHRALRLPDTVDADKAEPLYENGILSITLPKVEARKARELKVKVGGRETERKAA